MKALLAFQRSVSVLGFAGMAACAQGVAAGDDPIAWADAGGARRTSSGDIDASTTGRTPHSATPTDSGASNSAAEASVANTTNGDSGGQPAVDPSTTCVAATQCPGVRNIGSLSGDTGAQVLTATGTISEWLSVRVTEDDGGLSAVAVRAKLTLTSPPGVNFDLYVYPAANEQQATIECSSVGGSSASSDSTDLVPLNWADTQGFGGHDDSRNLTVEVRYVSGTCGSTSAWSLKVEGNK